MFVCAVAFTAVFGMMPSAVFAADAEEITPSYTWYGDGTAEEFTISSVYDLAGFAKLTQGNVKIDETTTLTKTNFAGKTVKLSENITFADNQYWYFNDGTKTYDYTIKSFAGTFDGNDHTISNMRYANGSGNKTIAFFEKIVAGGYVKNLTIDTVSVDFTVQSTFCTVVGTLAGEAVNCHVKNVTVESTQKLGANGFGNVNSGASATNCTIDGLNVTTTWQGSVALSGAGFGTCSGTVTGCSVKNLTATTTMGENKFNGFGTINGTFKSNTVENVTLVAQGTYQMKEISGFGSVGASAYVEDCHVKTLNIRHEGTALLQKAAGFTYACRGTVKDCTVTDVTFTSKYSVTQIGGFVNEAYGGSSFENCQVNNIKIDIGDETNPKTLTCVAGFMGQSRDGAISVKNCHVTGLQMDLNSTVGSDTPAGFIAQAAGNTTFENCSVTGYINATYDNPNNRPIGGFVGNFGWGSGSTCTFTNCEANVDITSVGPAGGFVGQVKPQGSSSTTDVTFTDCDVTGDVTSTTATAGGFAAIGDSGTFVNCTVSGDITGETTAGGFIGELRENKNGDENITLTGCDVSGSVTSAEGSAGGLIGYIQSDVTTTFDSSCTPAANVTGAITSEVANASDKVYTLNDDGSITVEDAPAYLCYGKIGAHNIGFMSIQAAVDAGASTVTLLANSNESFTLKRDVTDSFTLALGEFTYNGVITVMNEIGSFTATGTSTGNNIVLSEPFKDHYTFNGWCSGIDTEIWAAKVEGGWNAEVGTSYHTHWTKSDYIHLDHSDLHPNLGIMVYGGNASTYAQTVTFVKESNLTGDEAITGFVAEADYFDLSYEGLTLTIKPKNGLDVGVYEEIIHVKVNDGSTHGITAKFTVIKAQAVINVDTTNLVVVYGSDWQLPSADTNVGAIVEIDKTVDDIKAIGTHTVTYSVAETDNYYGATKQIKVTVIMDPSSVQSNLEQLEKELDEAITNLNTAIDGKASKDELEKAIDELTKAYENADKIMQEALKQNLDNEVAALKTLIADTDDKLSASINKVAGDLDAAKSELNTAITNGDTALADKINALDVAYKAADALINSDIASLKNEDTAIKESIDTLESSLSSLETELKGMITSVQDNLNSTKTALESAIAKGDTELADKINALDDAYKAADVLINSDIAGLKDENAAIKLSLASLEGSLATVRSELEDMIADVQSNLDAAKADLEKAMANGDSELQSKIDALDSAYKAANALLDSDFAKLQAEDVEIKASIDVLEDSLSTAKGDLEAAIAQLQKNLDDTKAELEKAQNELKEQINAIVIILVFLFFFILFI